MNYVQVRELGLGHTNKTHTGNLHTDIIVFDVLWPTY